MRKQFSSEMNQAETEFDRRFAIYKRKTEGELRRERQLYREMRARESELLRMIDSLRTEFKKLSYNKQDIENRLRKAELTVEDKNYQISEINDNFDMLK